MQTFVRNVGRLSLGPLVVLALPVVAFGSNAPTIFAVQNNYSYILPGTPNYGIAPGSIFIIIGAGLSRDAPPVLQSSAPPGLPTVLNGTSISVNVNGTPVTPAIYYTSDFQLAAILPSNTSTGTGTIAVTYNGQTSAPAPIVVIASGPGLGTYYGYGTGMAVAEDANYNLFTNTASASPGQTIILWGSGVGADTANDDRLFPQKQNNLTNTPFLVYIGGLQSNVLYRGRSQYPGVDQVVVTIPSSVSVGCSVSVAAVSGNIVSNVVALPIAKGGGTCSDSTSFANPFTPNLTQSVMDKATVTYGSLGVLQSTTTRTSTASVAFYRYAGSDFTANVNAGRIPSIGSCVVFYNRAVANPPADLDAGTLSLTGSGIQVTLQKMTSPLGPYYLGSLSAIPASGATYTFTATGTKDVGAFSATVNFPPPLSWTNQAVITVVNRVQGQTVTWTGGAPGTYVAISGQSQVSPGSTVTFICNAAVETGQFTIPNWVLLALPASNTGGLSVTNLTGQQRFTSPGLDFGYGFGESDSGTTVTYQ